MPTITTKISLPTFKKSLPFSVDYVSISEAFDRHHTFELTATLALNKELSNKEVKDILGEYITIEISESKTVKHTFKGITDSLVLFQQGDSRMIRIEGYSPTILLDSAPVFRAFTEKPVKQIAEHILQNYKSASVSFPNVSYQGTQKADFSMQTQETDYQYLCRLADRFESNFYYDGEQFHFCPIKDAESDLIELTINKNLHHFRAAVNLSPVKFSVSGYNLLSNKNETESYNLPKKGNALMQSAIHKSKVYPTAEISVNHLIEDKNDLQTAAYQLATQQTNSMVTITGGSDVPSIKVGSILDIKGGGKSIPGFDKQENFRVTQVVHSVSNSGQTYSNSFSAIPEDHDCPVNMSGAQSKISAPLNAEVVDTADPENYGRIKVKFLADVEQSSSPWLRVLTPFSSENGYFFMPEVGEKVVVFFEDFNPEKSAFVMGSFFTKDKNAAHWQDADNRKKGISTGDISLLFDENEGKLTLKAKSILLQTDEGVSIEGGKEIKQKAQNIESSAEQKNTLSGSQSVKVKGGRIDLN